MSTREFQIALEVRVEVSGGRLWSRTYHRGHPVGVPVEVGRVACGPDGKPAGGTWWRAEHIS